MTIPDIVAEARQRTISAWSQTVGRDMAARLTDAVQHFAVARVDTVSQSCGMQGITGEVSDLGFMGLASHAATRDA